MTFYDTVGFAYTVIANLVFTAALFWLAYHGLRQLAGKAIRDITSYNPSGSCCDVTATVTDPGFESRLLRELAK